MSVFAGERRHDWSRVEGQCRGGLSGAAAVKLAARRGCRLAVSGSLACLSEAVFGVFPSASLPKVLTSASRSVRGLASLHKGPGPAGAGPGLAVA